MPTYRQTPSKAAIKTALLTLLQEKSFEAISVTDIAKRAAINRGTFYLHYLDKFDLIEQMVKEVTDEITAILLTPSDSLDLPLYRVLLHLKTHHELIHILTSSSAIDLPKELTNFLLTLFQRSPRFLAAISQEGMTTEYSLISFCGSVSAVTQHWLERGCPESPETLTQMMAQLRTLYEGR